METLTIKTWWERLKAFVHRHWQPKPIDPPTVDPDLERLSGVQRAAETMRFSVLSVEFWISPKGQVREWLKKNTLLAVVLAIPAFLVLPVVTFALWQFVSWAMALTSIAGKLIALPILVLLAIASFAAAILLLRFILGR